MAVYTNDLRLKEIATGDEAGTWGNSTNTNLQLIADAFGFGTEAITTNADTHTTTIADGSADPGRSIFLKYTGTLDSACTITIGPNTVSKLWFIENATSGSQNIIIKQGSGATVTIPAGDTKAIYSDGAGSGGAMVDAFASLNVVDLKVEDDLTVTDDLIVNGDIDLEGSIDVNGTANLDVVDIDGAVDMASTLQVDGAITSSAGATITVADNSDVLTLVSTDADANPGPILALYRNSASPADADSTGRINFQAENSAGETITYSQIFSSVLDVTDGTEDGRYKIGTMVAGSFDSRMDMTNTETVFNEDSVDLDFRVESNARTHGFFVDGGTSAVSIGVAPRSDIHSTWGQLFLGEKGSLISENLSSGGLFGMHVSDNLYVDSDTGAFAYITADEASLYTQEAGKHQFFGVASGSAGAAATTISRLEIDASGNVVFNEGGNDSDFRVEGNNNANLLNIDAGNDYVGVGRVPNANLDVQASSTGTLSIFRIRNSGTDAASEVKQIFSLNRTGSDVDFECAGIVAGKEQNWTTTASTVDGFLAFRTIQNETTAEKMRIDSSGDVLVGTTSAASEAKVHVETATSNPNSGSPTASSALMVNGGTTTEGNGPVVALRNISGSKETIARLCAETVSGNNGDLTISVYAGGSTVDEKIRVQSGGGISFNGDTAAANALDDYEEGTFDATIISDSGSITVDTSDNLCFYTKIGRLVTVSGRISPSSVSSPSGQLYVGNLPFALASAGETSHAGAVACNIYNAASNFGGEVVAEMTTTGSARILIRGNGGTTSAVHAAAANIDSGSLIGFTATYPST
jgi:hypothetical protein